MEYRQLGRSGLRISTLTLGTMTFAGKGGFNAVGNTDLEGAKRQIGMALDAGVNLIDTADVYSGGISEEIVGQAIKGKRDDLLLSSKVRMTMGDGPNDAGLSRHHIITGLEASLRRLDTDHIDIYHVHEWDGQTPVEETLSTLDSLVKAGKIRYLAASNYSGWQLMKALAGAAARGPRPSRSTTRWRPATPSTSWCRWPWTRGWASWSGARWRAACCPASSAATPTSPRSHGTSTAGPSRRGATRAGSQKHSRAR